MATTRMSGAAERGRAIVDMANGYDDIVSMLADIDAFLLADGRQPIDVVSTYARTMSLERMRLDEVWDRRHS